MSLSFQKILQAGISISLGFSSGSVFFNFQETLRDTDFPSLSPAQLPSETLQVRNLLRVVM